MPLTPMVAVAPGGPAERAPAVEPPPSQQPPQPKPAPPRDEQPTTPPKPVPPPVPPKPGVFDGGAGFVRALAFGFAAGSTAAAITSLVGGTKKGDDARGILGKLQQTAGASPCIQGSPNLASGCREVTALNQAHDNRGALAAGLFVAAGVAGAAA